MTKKKKKKSSLITSKLIVKLLVFVIVIYFLIELIDVHSSEGLMKIPGIFIPILIPVFVGYFTLIHIRIKLMDRFKENVKEILTEKIISKIPDLNSIEESEYLGELNEEENDGFGEYIKNIYQPISIIIAFSLAIIVNVFHNTFFEANVILFEIMYFLMIVFIFYSFISLISVAIGIGIIQIIDKLVENLSEKYSGIAVMFIKFVLKQEKRGRKRIQSNEE